MALAIAILANIQFISTTPTAIYANPSGFKAYVREIVLHNVGTATETVKLYEVMAVSGGLGIAGINNRLTSLLITGGDTVFLEFHSPRPFVNINDAIFAETTSANTVSISITGGLDVL